MKKGQLTMFVILGIVIISVFGFVFFATGQVSQQKAQEQADVIFGDILQTSSLQYYINLCADKALKEGINTLSRQGGRLLPSQPGSLLPTSYKVLFTRDESIKKDYFVSYAIMRGSVPLPQYPCVAGYLGFNDGPAFCPYRSTNPNFNNLDIGINNLPPLCKNRFGGCSIEEGWSSRFSVQAQLESYISQEVKDCVDFESIVSVNLTYDVQEGNVTTNVSFSDSAVSAVVDFPLIIAPKESQPVIRLVSFQGSIQSRFKQAYALARTVVGADVSSSYLVQFKVSTFDVVKNFADILRMRYKDPDPGFVIQKQKDVSSNDDFIKIVDMKADPANPLYVQFGIENRPPVLEYPNNEETSLDDKPIDTGCGVYDIVLLENQQIKLIPEAFDTEEDDLIYESSGWLINYEEVNNVIDSQTGCPTIISTQEAITNPPKHNVIIDPNDHSISTLLTKKDMGPHNITMKVCDGQYCDYQTIRILVDDLVSIEVDKKNKYNTLTFSVEDPYSFTASIKDVYRPSTYRFTWSIYKTGDATPSYFDESGEQSLNIPNGEFTIFNIKNKITEFMPGGFLITTPPTEYVVVGKVSQFGYEVSNETKIKPALCVPFAGVGNKQPYPYTDQDDAFMGAHSCCYVDASNIPQLNGTSAVCFKANTYGSIFSFNQSKYATPDYDNTISGANKYSPSTLSQVISGVSLASLQTLPNINSNSANDIILRTFNRSCDSTRGNICGGLVKETYSIPSDGICADKSTLETARCQGPPSILLAINNDRAYAGTPLCENYDGFTFESKAREIKGQPAGDITCNAQPKCVSNNNAIDGFTNINGPLQFVCNATCGGVGGCSRTKPEFCQNCYQSQSCIGPTDIGASLLTTSTAITVTKLNPNLCSGNACSLGTSISVSNKCIDSENLTANYCISNNPSSFSTSNINLSQKYNCKYFQETNANDLDNETGFGGCYDFLGSCPSLASNKCLPGSNTLHQDGGPDTVAGKLMFREYVAQDMNGNSINETCIKTNIDYDFTSQSVCEGALGGLQGTWNPTNIGQKKCCGDDTGENKGSNNLDCSP